MRRRQKGEEKIKEVAVERKEKRLDGLRDEQERKMKRKVEKGGKGTRF